MKRIILTLCTGILMSMSSMQADFLSDAADKAKQTAKSAWNKTKQTWENLDDSTKNTIIAGGIATATGAATYGAYQYANSGDTQSTLRTAEEVRAGLPESPEMKAKWDSYAPTVPPRSKGAYQERLQKYEQETEQEIPI